MRRKAWNPIVKLSKPNNMNVTYPATLTPNRQLWRDLGVEESHILPGNTKDNFWGK
jgi:alanyl-tRNA synthetase